MATRSHPAAPPRPKEKGWAAVWGGGGGGGGGAAPPSRGVIRPWEVTFVSSDTGASAEVAFVGGDTGAPAAAAAGGGGGEGGGPAAPPAQQLELSPTVRVARASCSRLFLEMVGEDGRTPAGGVLLPLVWRVVEDPDLRIQNLCMEAIVAAMDLALMGTPGITLCV